MELIWLVFELVNGLYGRWFESSVERARRNQARGHIARGQEFLKEGRSREAKIEFNCASYYGSHETGLPSKPENVLSICLRQAHRRHRRVGIYPARNEPKQEDH
jgi:hypothetical protein